MVGLNLIKILNIHNYKSVKIFEHTNVLMLEMRNISQGTSQVCDLLTSL